MVLWARGSSSDGVGWLTVRVYAYSSCSRHLDFQQGAEKLYGYCVKRIYQRCYGRTGVVIHFDYLS